MPITLHRFGAFELDRSGRSLRLNGRELGLQPQVFDVLCFLVDNRQRVVSKEELLETLWPGVVVTESSLQRAISVARAALQQGGLKNAIRNYARRGYRFELEVGDAADAMAAGDSSALALADQSFAGARWQEAMQRYADADRSTPLDAETLERWAAAAQCAGDLAGAALPLERAAVSYSSRSAHEAAARVTIALARVHIESLSAAVAQGCLRRAERLLSGVATCAQHGMLAATTARLHLYMGDLTGAVAQAAAAHEIGRSLRNTEIEALGLLYWGIALQAVGETARGLEMQNEAAAAVLAGDVSPLHGGLIYCGVISSCCNCEDWLRAEQWTESFAGWCERGNIDTFAGACLIHRAEALAMTGKLAEARDTIVRADPILRTGAPWALGDASRLMGDLLRASGEHAAAERSYREAYSQGWDPYPGYAVLLHESGRSDEAIGGLRRAAESTNWQQGERRARYLAHAVEIAALAGRLDEARALLGKLDAMPASWESGAVAGHVGRGRAELLWATEQSDDAVQALRQAIDVLKKYNAVVDVAVARTRLAEWLFARAERGAGELELGTAEAALANAGALGYLERCRVLRSAPHD
jgi:DNA-binding winged helix-turn-helix (wHTH) protein